MLKLKLKLKKQRQILLYSVRTATVQVSKSHMWLWLVATKLDHAAHVHHHVSIHLSCPKWFNSWKVSIVDFAKQ